MNQISWKERLEQFTVNVLILNLEQCQGCVYCVKWFLFVCLCVFVLCHSETKYFSIQASAQVVLVCELVFTLQSWSHFGAKTMHLHGGKTMSGTM